MNPSELMAIDIHTHAERSCRQPVDEIQAEFDSAASTYFKIDAKRPSIAEPSPTIASAKSAL